MKLKNGFRIFLQVVLGLFFIGASVYKILDPEAFARQILNYQLLPVIFINPLAIILPWIQFWAGLALITNRGVSAGLAWIILMLIVFLGAVISALLRGLNISCGCFQAGGDNATWISVIRDFLILLAAVALAWLRSQRKKNDA